MKITCYGVVIDVFEAYYKPAGFKELPPQPTMDGASLRRLGNVPGDYTIQLADGTAIGYRDAVQLQDGMEIFAVPPAYSGGAGR